MLMIYNFLVLGLPALCMAWIHESGYECPETWFFDKASKSCVKPYHKKKAWNAARKLCKKEGSDLIVIKSKKTTNTVKGLLKRRKDYWIGIRDDNADGVYTYVDGSDVTKKYHAWKKGEPSNDGGKEKCVDMKGNKKGHWSDRLCNKRKFFVCQVPAKLMLECPPEWKLYEEDKLCILPYKERMSWNNARSTCQGAGGDLLKLDKQELAHFIKDDVEKRTRYWIGARSPNKNGIFQFIDGEEVGNFHRWARLEPNNHGGKEHCLEIIGNNRLAWNDKRCGRKRKFVCERPADIAGNTQVGANPPPVKVIYKK